MDRPRDQLCWDNVDKLPNGKLRCKHCKKEFSGTASGIRNHLSGQGTDIEACEMVPPSIREEALKRGSKKRGRVDSSASGEGNDEISTVANIGNLSINKDNEQESATDAIVKFCVSRDIPIDALKDPHFMTFLTRIAQHGFPSCLLRRDSIEIQKSLLNLEHEVNEYMIKVKESWKTTGCTLICYNLDEWIGISPNSEKYGVVYGFYCPQGFIFVQGPLFESVEHLEGFFKNHVLNLPIDDVQHYIYHYGYQMCEFAKEDADFYHDDKRHCSQQQFQQFWKSICTKSGWVRNFMHKSENLYEFMLNSSFRREGWEKAADQNDGDATPWRAFTRLKSIMHLEDGIKEYVTQSFLEKNDGDVREIVNNKEFWSDGKELLAVVTPLMHIIGLLDTLVPTSGYLPVAVQKAKDNLKPYYERDASKYQIIWDWLDHFDTSSAISNEVAICLSPFYDCGPEKCFLEAGCVFDDEEEYEKFEAEAEVYKYNNPFANLSSYQRNNHPVTLWKDYGGDFPVLRKYAIKAMSQPVSCLCNQVKKHILQCQGADNFILRLNYQMMQQFTKLGDRIYEPLESRFFEAPKLPQSIPSLAPNSTAYKPSSDHGILEKMVESLSNLIATPSPKNIVNGPHIDQIPAWMNAFISKSTDVLGDGNCGYRAIAESYGLGEDKWCEVRKQLCEELKSQSHLHCHTGPGPAPFDTWLEVTDMGLLVATTFQAKFVVVGHSICSTFLPLYLPEGCLFSDVPEIVVCLLQSPSHFVSLSLTHNAPLPPIYNMWFRHHQPSTQSFDLFLSKRCDSYNKLAETQHRPKEEEMPPIEVSSAAYLDQIPSWMNEFILNSIDVVADGNCGYRAIAESVGLGQDSWHEVRLQLYNELISQPQLYEPTFRDGDVETISKALLHDGSGFAPPETWLDVTDMGLLVATTFRAKFVVLGSTICCTYLPLYLPEGWQFYNVPEIVVCMGHNLRFSSLSLADNAPLPPISNMWLSNRQPSTQDLDRFLSDRCASYNKAATQYSQRGKPSPTNMIYEPLKIESLAGPSLNVPKEERKFDDFGFQNIKLECPSDFKNADERQNDTIMGEMKVKLDITMEEMKGELDSTMEEMKGELDSTMEEMNEKHDGIMEGKHDSIMEEKHNSITEKMKDCFSIFFLIPTDYEFEEDTLVQLWMAMECVDDESEGQVYFSFLLKGEHFLHSGTDFVTRKARYRINTPRIKDYLDLQRDIDGSFYLKWENANEFKTNVINSTKIEHVSLVCNDIDSSTFQTLEQFSELQTLLFLRNYGSKVTHVPDHLFLSLQKLQALDLSGTHIKKLSSFVGSLIHLRYLNLSRTLIEWLPDTICSLHELQTLRLKGCSELRGLPKGLKKLTELRHLEVGILRQLATFPGGIGDLVNLRTLSAFLVSTEDGCKIQELKELNNLTGDFCIAMLENVGNGDEAKEAALSNKQYLNKLELRWTTSQLSRTNNNCYDVLKRLRPCSSLKELQIFGYEGSTFPGWISDPKFNQLVSITFLNCENVLELPFIDQLPFLKNLELVKMSGVKKIERRGKSEEPAFFRLEKLEVDEMQSLRSWNWRTENRDDFKSLVELTIKDCPGLREFHVLSCLSSIKHLEVKGCPELESLSETKLPDCLEDLIIEDCPMIKRNCSPKGGEDWKKIKHVSNLRICEDDDEDEDDDEL